MFREVTAESKKCVCVRDVNSLQLLFVPVIVNCLVRALVRGLFVEPRVIVI